MRSDKQRLTMPLELYRKRLSFKSCLIKNMINNGNNNSNNTDSNKLIYNTKR